MYCITSVLSAHICDLLGLFITAFYLVTRAPTRYVKRLVNAPN